MESQTAAEMDGLIQRIIQEGVVTSTESFSFVSPRIEKGMYIVKSVDSTDPKDDIFILLDDVECAHDFLNRAEITMQDIINYFDTSKPSYAIVNNHELDGRKVVPWSQITRDRVGQCLEMAIMSQLRFQRKPQQSFLCGGRSNQDLLGTHAWNLIKWDNQYFIWDCGLGFYAPLERAEIRDAGLHLYPNYERSVGNPEKIVYQIGGESPNE